MPGRKCYHCGEWIEEPKSHDCWTTTEEKLTQDLPEDLRDAWTRIRETALTFGEQRIYASHKSIMFARKTCYFFVRPKKAFLEVCFFLGRSVKHPTIRNAQAASKTKVGHMVRVVHRDEVEAPLTDWLKEAFDFGVPATKVRTETVSKKKKPAPKKKTPGKKVQTKKTVARKKK